jgi:hypothetical protein
MGFFLGKLVTYDDRSFSIIIEKDISSQKEGVLAQLRVVMAPPLDLAQLGLPTLPLLA